MFFLLACTVSKPPAGDSAADSGGCALTLDPTSVELTDEAPTAFVTPTTCEGSTLAADCSEGLSAAPSAAVRGAWIVSGAAGSCSFSNGSTSAELSVTRG